ncbi:MAG: DUF167 domain-containing protein [Dehalococcoidia bacterium]
MVTARLNIRVTPRSSRNEVRGFVGDVLQVRVTAAPVDGRANEAVVRLLAEHLGVPRTAVRIVAGNAAREKLVAVDGLTTEELRGRLVG